MRKTLKRMEPRDWPEEWLASILTATAAMAGKYDGVTRAQFWRAYVLVARDTNFSRGRMLAIRWDGITPDGSLVLRMANEPTPVVARLCADTLLALEPLRQMMLKSGKVFAVRLSETQLHNHWQQLLRLAGFDPKAAELPHYNAFPGILPEAEPCPKTKRLLLRTFLEETYATLRLGGKSPRTLTCYRFTVRNFGRYLKREPLLSDLTDENFAGLLMWMRERGKAAASVRKEYDQLIAIWRFACQRHSVKDYPTIQRPGAPDRAPLAWSQPELLALFKAIDALPGWIEGCRANAWWRALHFVIWNSGERISAVMNLEWSHVDLRGGWLRVPAELRKGKGEDKVFALAPYTVEALRAIEQPRRALVFPWPMTQNYVWRRYERILKAAGLPIDKWSKFHRLRRSVATHFEAAGGDATALLGHSARSVTVKHYLDQRVVKPKQAADLLFRPDQDGKAGAA